MEREHEKMDEKRKEMEKEQKKLLEGRK